MSAELLSAQRRELLAARATTGMSLRATLAQRGYVQVDTPILEPAGHSADEPVFRTWSRAFGTLRLRTVAEPYLKRLVAGGLDRVFDIARSFRDEPADTTHNLEYSLLEAYEAHAGWKDMQALAAELIHAAARAVNGTTTVTDTQGEEIDLASSWPTRAFHAAISHVVSEDVGPDTPRRDLARIAYAYGINVEDRWPAERIAVALYEHLVEPATPGPVVYTGFPASIAPQARPQDDDPRLAEQWDLVIRGREVATGATEITDLHDQLQHVAHGPDSHARRLHPLLREALEAGMPPCGGLAIGFDRLVMTLVGATELRSVIPFPTRTPTGDDPSTPPG